MAHRRTAVILVPSAAYLLSLILTASSASVRAQDVQTVWDGVYTDDQATRGEQLYATNCTSCHQKDLSGTEDGAIPTPALRGNRFTQKWEGSTLADLVSRAKETKPPEHVGGLSDDDSVDIVSFILKTNRFPSGKEKLVTTRALLGRIVIVPDERDRKTVWDGVYTAAQAAKGEELFQARCSSCHNTDFTGTEKAPGLKGDRFWQTWELSNLTNLTSKIRDDKRRANNDLNDESWMAIVARILQANGFPPGNKELRWLTNELTPLQIVKSLEERLRTVTQIPNFALVEVVGCLAPGAKAGWILTNASDPVVIQAEEPTPADIKSAETKPLGTGTFNLVSADQWSPAANMGHRVEVRGTLRRLPNDMTISITSLTQLPGACN